MAAADKPAITFAAGARKVMADEVANLFIKEIQDATCSIPESDRPKLVAFLANGDPAAQKYAQWTAKTFGRDGLNFEVRSVEPDDLDRALEEANGDKSVHGIMIYYPVFGTRLGVHGGSHDEFLRDNVSLTKDVEGLCHFYRRTMYINQRFVDVEQEKKCVLPCTPLAVVKLLEHLGAYDQKIPVGNRMTNKVVTVVNRSEVVGRPLAAMLANDGALVYSIDIDSTYIFRRGKVETVSPEETTQSIVEKSDILVLAVPAASYKMNPAWVKEGAIVINVASCKNIDADELLSTRPGVTFVPAVGKVTIAMLERNLLRLYNNFKGASRLIWDSSTGCVAPVPDN
mmetsp:Transcript_10113/g.22390  ORF Transcript_10113/g.22390 Transcript_10113/m.22390 type:complete len:342 (-) Transcript_10113:362-1387(-)|eukprot:CAMPEP_0206457558 /NCGR_PEP_ID=MMETSP0324_2-20121206/23038_1 /ASSEMBLY_ACC=CAM_ASM_000836 /TAXON_ID=2866 /ORGANISM="Crypthecodinium cohnii, Strain Seligo" /LENGTH=341 /DNA_ID=CAMNT_0053928713 /DNA_START=193 /DNA_END=1218 /DNA_ORIENTATION=+